jgi:hypothetical protein
MNCRIGRQGTAISMALWLIIAMSWTLPDPTEARRVRNDTRTSVNRNLNQNRNVNRNVNVNQNRNINVNRDIDIDVDHDYHDYHPVATAVGVTAAVAITAAVVGSIVYSLPPACSAVVVNGLTYQSCGGTWYQPQYVGTQVIYVVVNPPR